MSPQKSTDHLEGIDQEALSRIIAHTLQKDLQGMQAQQSSMKKLEMELKRMYHAGQSARTTTDSAPSRVPRMSRQVPGHVHGIGQVHAVGGEAPNRYCAAISDGVSHSERLKASKHCDENEDRIVWMLHTSSLECFVSLCGQLVRVLCIHLFRL